MHELIQRYLGALSARGRAPATIRATRSDLAQVQQWWEAAVRRPFEPTMLLDHDVRDWQRARQVDDGVAPATINRALSSLRGFCTWAVSQHLLLEDPTVRIGDLPRDDVAPQAVADEAVDLLFRVAHRQSNGNVRRRDEAVLAILVYTGVRCQEACDLQLRDLDLAGGNVTIRRGKGGLPRRIPLHPTAQRLLTQYLMDVRARTGMPEVGSVAERAPLLINLDRAAQQQQTEPGISPRGVAKIVSRLGHATAEQLRVSAERTAELDRTAELHALADRLDHLAPHMLRHSLARRLLHHGAHLPEVQRILGHRRLSTTGRYLTASDDDLRAAINRAGVDELPTTQKKSP